MAKLSISLNIAVVGIFALGLAGLLDPALGQTSAAKPAAKRGKAAPVTSEPLTESRKVDAMVSGVFDEVAAVADAHFHKGEYNHIVNLSRMIVAAQPENMDIYASAGWLLWSMDRDAEAIALYEQGIAANPRSAYMYDELAQYYYNRKKDYARAVHYYELAAGKSDCEPMTLHMLAHAYERNKQMDKALVTWKRAMDHDSTGAARTNYDRVKRLVSAGIPVKQ